MGLLGAAFLALLVVPPPLGASVSGPGREPSAVGYGGGVVSTDDEATRTAQAVLADGGGSVDAALAAAAVLAVRSPAAGGLGGGSAVLHVDGADGSIRMVDGCSPAGAYAAWALAARTWGSLPLETLLADARTLAHGALGRTVRDLQAGRPTALAAAEPARPVVRTLTARAEGAFRVAGGVVGTRGHVAADAYVSVLVADRRGDVTAVVSSMGRRGGSGEALGGSGLVLGSALPGACGDALPSVVLRSAAAPQPASVELAVAATTGRKPVPGGVDALAGQREVLRDRVLRGAPLDAVLRAQPAAVLAVELDPDGQVHAAADGRRGGSAAVVHGSGTP
ncbi:gamma-glutamyltranspeptidase [Motilibacter peucedani]|uniref:Gamma-glutamyltranspeptidase n=2 Tax=Motilibacter peucedani TaxID=598650 RepID=A0A420XRD1_9ACTN|nr:gamma-glutamyltranspeptidase [Motilibacter peucedani]